MCLSAAIIIIVIVVIICNFPAPWGTEGGGVQDVANTPWQYAVTVLKRSTAPALCCEPLVLSPSIRVLQVT